LREQIVATLENYSVACWTPGNLADRTLRAIYGQFGITSVTQMAGLAADAAAFRALRDKMSAPAAPAEALERIPLAEHTEETLTELYDAIEDTERDRAETREAAQAMYKAWDWHRNTLGGAARAIVSVCNMMRTAASHYERDWTNDRHDAYLYAVLIGWDDDTLQEVATRHRWNEHRIKYVREIRALLAPITDPQPKED